MIINHETILIQAQEELPVDYRQLSQSQRAQIRNLYRKIQDDVCIYCRSKLCGPPSDSVNKLKINMGLFPPNFLFHPVHLHHNHKTGMTIGAVHSRCNAALWQYQGE